MQIHSGRALLRGGNVRRAATDGSVERSAQYYCGRVRETPEGVGATGVDRHGNRWQWVTQPPGGEVNAELRALWRPGRDGWVRWMRSCSPADGMFGPAVL